jgi:dihydrodipicolinate synthase/N-acetylneuraminate lyase
MWNDAANSLFIASNPIPAKALLALEGRINHDTMMPPLSRRDLTDLGALKISSQNVREWYKKNK